MSEQIEGRLLKQATAMRIPLQRLSHAATGASQMNWEIAQWQRQEAAQRVFETCQCLIEAIDHCERMLSQPPPIQPKRKR